MTPALLAATFWGCVVRGDGSGCWIWNFMLDRASGYGTTQLTGSPEATHVVAWELEHGPLPDGMTVEHVMRCNTACVRPSHLAAVPGARPVVGASSIREPLAVLDPALYCKRGHERPPVGTCQECRKENAKKRLEEIASGARVKRDVQNQHSGKTHCKNGHELAGDNISVRPDGTRRCKQCQVDRNRAYQDAQKAKRASASDG